VRTAKIVCPGNDSFITSYLVGQGVRGKLLLRFPLETLPPRRSSVQMNTRRLSPSSELFLLLPNGGANRKSEEGLVNTRYFLYPQALFSARTVLYSRISSITVDCEFSVPRGHVFCLVRSIKSGRTTDGV